MGRKRRRAAEGGAAGGAGLRSWDASPGGATGTRFLRLRGEGPRGEPWMPAGTAAERVLRALKAQLLEVCGAVGGAVPLRQVATLAGGDVVLGVPQAWEREVAGAASLACRVDGAACRLQVVSQSDSLMRVLGGGVSGVLWGGMGTETQPG